MPEPYTGSGKTRRIVSSEEQARDAFPTIAQAEKGHMQTLIKAIGECG